MTRACRMSDSAAAESSPFVGESAMTMLWPQITSTAMLTRRRSPPLMPRVRASPTTVLAVCVNPSSSSVSCSRSCWSIGRRACVHGCMGARVHGTGHQEHAAARLSARAQVKAARRVAFIAMHCIQSLMRACMLVCHHLFLRRRGLGMRQPQVQREKQRFLHRQHRQIDVLLGNVSHLAIKPTACTRARARVCLRACVSMLTCQLREW